LRLVPRECTSREHTARYRKQAESIRMITRPALEDRPPVASNWIIFIVVVLGIMVIGLLLFTLF